MNSVTKGLFVAGVVAGLALTNVSATQATNVSKCVDGSVRTGLKVTWDGPSTAIINTADNRALCDDVELYLSSYTLPDNYNGQGFGGNPTATPQELYASTEFTLVKGTKTEQRITVEVPDECTHVQSDVYYPPEVKTVGPSGHPSDQIVQGKIFERTKKDCTPVVIEEPETPVVETPEVETPEVIGGGEGEATPTELPKTGASANVLLALISSVGAYAAVLRLRK